MADGISPVVTWHDAEGRSVFLSEGAPPQHHQMSGPAMT